MIYAKKIMQSEIQMWFENIPIVVEIPLLPGKVNLEIDNSFFLESQNIEGTFLKTDYETQEPKINNNNNKQKYKD